MTMVRSSGELGTLSDDDTNIFQHTILDYYRDRPTSLESSSFMLLCFGSWYVKIHEPRK